jgi:two-component system phosphate regulon sensor histidine kinase PhoR
LEDDNINMAYLKKAAKNIERLSQIVGDIDLISKIESSALKLNKTKFSIESLITESIEDLELMADKNDIKIKLEATIKHSNVAADKERIKEVLINLISNSLKYGIEKGETTISLFDLEDKILIRIADNGLGIKKEQLPRIFERFYRIDDNRSRAQGGSGLGLAIVKHLIEAHKQKITVKSEFGAGSIFEFTLKKV